MRAAYTGLPSESVTVNSMEQGPEVPSVTGMSSDFCGWAGCCDCAAIPRVTPFIRNAVTRMAWRTLLITLSDYSEARESVLCMNSSRHHRRIYDPDFCGASSAIRDEWPATSCQVASRHTNTSVKRLFRVSTLPSLSFLVMVTRPVTTAEVG